MDTHIETQVRRSLHLESPSRTLEVSRSHPQEMLIHNIPVPRMASQHAEDARPCFAASPPMTSFAQNDVGYYPQQAYEPQGHAGIPSQQRTARDQSMWG